jgi:hypothetical protein
MQIQPRKRVLAAIAIASYLVIACFAVDSDRGRRHGWYSGLGVVVPHDNFPADCTLCHVGSDWQSVKSSFEFDHEAETGVRLDGAHESAQCLRCHNDRGPAGMFAARGCAGCHEDIHVGQLGRDCAKCHGEVTWNPIGQVELHDRTRFPLVGVHRATSCRRCHVGAEVGRFVPTDTECVTCHRDDLARATNPNHLGLGFVDRCDRCHQPTDWLQEELDP